MLTRARWLIWLSLPLLLLSTGAGSCGPTWTSPHEPQGHALFASPQVHPIALSPDGSLLFVAMTTSNKVVVIDTASGEVVARRLVGIDPVSVAVRPDGHEVWIANHVSDSVSVLDTDPASATWLEVISTIQDLDGSGVTAFDEPAGIAFASNAKAYVALSSTNQIAVVDIGPGYGVKASRLEISGQDPRAIAVSGGRLYVAAFESGNQSELSACVQGNDPPQCTLGGGDLAAFAVSPNLPGLVKNIVIDPDLPDRDLFVFDTATDAPVGSPVTGVGTLLYGLAVDGAGRVFVAQTEARNAVNGLDGASLSDLDNRIFLNQVAVVDCGGGGSCSFDPASDRIDLEPLPPSQPAAGAQLATPYGIAVSGDGSTVVATAAASSRVFTLNAATGAVRDIADVGPIPRGVALRSDAGGAPQTAYVLNTLGNSVSVVDVTNPDAISVTQTIAIGDDPTPAEVRLGRIAFNDAGASSTGTFACASCHPDAHTDQLLWRIGGACETSLDPDCGGDEPRLTMPVRGLKNTLPLHWDGTLGDPFGGGNGAVGPSGDGGTDCVLGDADGDHDCFLDVVDASLAGVMCDQSGACPPGGNELSAQERSDMATFLAGVFYPPARSRPLDDLVSASALDGFADFFMDQGGAGGSVETCADADNGCHALPLGASTNSNAVGGFDAPTMRGMTDRFIHFSNGFTGTQEILQAQTAWNPATDPLDEFVTFSAAFPNGFTAVYNVGPNDLFQMFEEASTGVSGATGRQVTLSVDTAADAGTLALLDALEAADARGAVNLSGDGVRGGTPVSVSYDADGDFYQVASEQLSRPDLEAEALGATLLVTLTGHLRRNVGDDAHPQPLLLPVSTGSGPTGNPDLPQLTGSATSMTLLGVDVLDAGSVLVDGAPVGASIACVSGTFSPTCTSLQVQITLDAQPPAGTHLLQIENEAGLRSPELPICVGNAAGCL